MLPCPVRPAEEARTRQIPFHRPFQRPALCDKLCQGRTVSEARAADLFCSMHFLEASARCLLVAVRQPGTTAGRDLSCAESFDIFERIAEKDAHLMRKAAAGGAGHVSGIDHSEVSCEASRHYNKDAIEAGQMDVTCVSVESLPFPDDSFDIVTTVESFYFWPDPEASLKEVARVVKPGGHFLLAADVYHTPGLAKSTLENIEHYHLTVLTPEEYEELLLGAGFSRAETHLKAGTTWIAVEGVK